MKIVLAPNAFKESLSAPEVAAALAAGIRRAFSDAEMVLLPVADGGDGTVEAMVAATGGELRVSAVSDPLGRVVSARWGLLNGGKTAVLDLAEASGLKHLRPHERDPFVTTTRGTGELIRVALEHDRYRPPVEEMIIGIGGSATTDGGVGLARALGFRFLNPEGLPVPDGGGHLAEIARIDHHNAHKRIADVRFLVATDVDNPLYGENGAAHVYAPQKGAKPEQVQALDCGLRAFADVLERDLNIRVRDLPGAGAAGGAGAGLVAFLNARLERGIDLILRTIGFDEKVQGADLVITGEGKVDAQTFQGKGPHGVAEAAAKHGVPVVCVAAVLAEGVEARVGDSAFTDVVNIAREELPFEEAKARTPDWLADAAENIVKEHARQHAK